MFVHERLGALSREREQIAAALTDCAAVQELERVDPKALAADLRAYVGRLEVDPSKGHALVFWKTIPAPPAEGTNGAGMSLRMVAGARI